MVFVHWRCDPSILLPDVSVVKLDASSPHLFAEVVLARIFFCLGARLARDVCALPSHLCRRLAQLCRYLFGLLTHRAFRDDNFCAQKYGEDWEKYKQKVPYMIIPGIF